MADLALTAIGSDRPGIIARVTGLLHEHGCNIEDSTMTILGGQFAMMLLLHTSAEARALEEAIAAGTSDLGLFVAVRAVGQGADSAPASHVLAVYGSDRPGIVHAVTSHLAERGVNVTDVTTRTLEAQQPVYAMVLEIALPDTEDADSLGDALAATVEGVEVSIHPLDDAVY